LMILGAIGQLHVFQENKHLRINVTFFLCSQQQQHSDMQDQTDTVKRRRTAT